MSVKYSAQQIYSVMRDAQLTLEQAAAVEESSFNAPALIVAGAGSGKTELMAVRVLWLVANGLARPEQILGLTFTRKAAAELNKRIYDNLLKLRDTQFWPEDLEYDFVAPNISTYNAYANSLFRDFALTIGYESDSVLLTESAAFQLAREVVLKRGALIDDRLFEIDYSIDYLVENVLALAAEMNDNLVSSSQIDEEIQHFSDQLAGLPQKAGSQNVAPYAYVTDAVNAVSLTSLLGKLAEAFIQEKRASGFVDYSDQVVLAERAARLLPEVGTRERQNYRQVLLDEYQDTSFLQTSLLRHLFSGTSVFAVGDPNQSIYGWRGASAANLNNFYQDFGAVADAKRYTLSTSWRNPKQVLELANNLIGELKVLELTARAGAPLGDVAITFEQDLDQETKHVADWFKANLKPDQTSALLMRKRSQMKLFVDAIENLGLEVEVVGLGGLLEMPEIVDLVSALRVIHHPDSGTELIRLLTGARWRIGVKDIERLNRYAKRKSYVDDEVREKQQQGLAEEDSQSLVDALDCLIDEKDPASTKISETGLLRLRNAAMVFRAMRSQTGMNLLEFVRSVEQELWLDIEVQANPRRKNPMAHLNAFASIVAGFSAANAHPTLGSFLKWLDFAEERERFEVPATNPRAGVVQVLTIHAAKGLEWDHVAIANLIDGDFPSTGKGSSGWISAGKVPYPLRGDHEYLPKLNLNVETQQEFKKQFDSFKDQMREYLHNEELRLMYVAVTRPKQNLLLTGSYWKPANKNPREASTFLVAAAELLGVQLPECESQVNPLELAPEIQNWPLNPLGENHESKLRVAADQVLTSKDSDQLDSIGAEIELLLAEREELLSQQRSAALPVRIPASRFKDYILNFEEVNRRLLRPMPAKPYQQTRTGTIFHAWVEQYFAAIGLPATTDDDGELNEFEGLEIAELQQNFESSRFAKLTPIDIEREIQLTIGGNTFICKLDAVFATDTGVEIVDWKTGRAPKDAEDEAARTLQLALYRLAYSRYTGLPLEQIAVSFYFVAENKEITPNEVPNEAQLLELWAKATN